MTTEQEQIRELEDTRQHDINAMLLAILLIERGRIDAAKAMLADRMPPYIAVALKARL